MSAICGAIGTDGRPFTARDLTGILAVLDPLGPDGAGDWSGTVGRCGVAVGARIRWKTPEDRLEVQPLMSTDGSVVVVADLRLDNRRELQHALSVPDRVDVPDSAFVLAAYERWGRDLPNRLQGEFAIAVVDGRRGGVLLVRDHLGNRPLVLHRRMGVVAFASNALSLTGFQGVGHRLDEERAKEVLGLLYQSERTFVDGVSWVPDATAVWVDDRGIDQWRWWQPAEVGPIALGSQDAYEEALRAALDEAVASQLRSIGSVGSHASSGLDSSSVAATAARLLAPEPLRTYTSVPPPGSTPPVRPTHHADEGPAVRDLAAMHPNILPTFLDVRGAAFFQGRYEPTWELGGGPPRNPANVVWLDAISEEARADGVTTLLSGTWGNMAFSADGPGWLEDLVRSRHLREAWRELRAWGQRSSLRSAVRELAVSPLVPQRARDLRGRLKGRISPQQGWFAATALRPELLDTLDTGDRLDPFLPRAGQDFRLQALGTAGIAASQADGRVAQGARWSLDERDPTADRRVIELALSFPESVLRHRGRDRAVARAAMADRLPLAITAATTRGQQLPDWLDRLTDAREEIINELRALRDHPLSCELVDVDRLDRAVRTWSVPGQGADRRARQELRLALLRALLLSRYLRWFDDRGGRSGNPT